MTDPTSLLDGTSPNSQITSVSPSNLPKFIREDLAEIIVIAPEEIRKRLGKTKDLLPTSDITHSLTKLAAFSIDGTYRVRSKTGVISEKVKGNLFSLATFPGKNNSVDFSLIFVTKWGRLYMHNLKCGNLTWLTDPGYISLSDGAKNILNTVLAFPSDEFYRRTDDLLEILNIKTGKNHSRAKRTLEKYLNELRQMEYVSWKQERDVYTIEYNLNPQSSKSLQSTKTDGDDGQMNERTQAIIDLAAHYDMLARNHLHVLEYYSLAKKNPSAHKNWLYFERVYDLAREKKWDPKVYLESQFALARKWKDSEINYPLPHMLLSQRGQEWYPEYVKDQNEKHGRSVNYKLCPRTTKTFEEEINEGIKETIKYLKTRLTQYRNSSSSSDRELCEYKIFLILHYWEYMSPFYLWSVQWFHKLLEELMKNGHPSTKVKEVVDYFDKLKENRAVQESILKQAGSLEKENGIPVNIDPGELV